MTPIRLDELGAPAERHLPAGQACGLADSGVVRVEPHPYHDGVWLLRDAGKVGPARVGDFEVWIEPRVRIDGL